MFLSLMADGGRLLSAARLPLQSRLRPLLNSRVETDSALGRGHPHRHVRGAAGILQGDLAEPGRGSLRGLRVSAPAPGPAAPQPTLPSTGACAQPVCGAPAHTATTFSMEKGCATLRYTGV